MPAHFLDRLYRPRTVALVGARTSPGFGFGIPLFWKKRGWLEKAFLVNPKGGEIQGRKVYSSVSELPEGIDLAVVIVPAPNVKEVLIELGRKGVRAVIVESAGFAETGAEGNDGRKNFWRSPGIWTCAFSVPTAWAASTPTISWPPSKSWTPPSNRDPWPFIAQSGVFGNILLDYLPEVFTTPSE